MVYARDGEEIYLGFVHDIFGRWTLTKGHLKDGESDHNGVVRKAKEEMNAVVEAVEDVLGSNEYIASNPEKGKSVSRFRIFSHGLLSIILLLENPADLTMRDGFVLQTW